MIKIKISSLWIHPPREGQQLHGPVCSQQQSLKGVSHSVLVPPGWPELGDEKPSPKGSHWELVPAPPSLEAKYWLVG